MNIIEFIEFIKLAREKDIEDKNYQMWCAMLGPMEKYIPFKDFNDILTGKNLDMRPADVIMAEIEEMKKGGN